MRPTSWANEIALVAANALTISDEKGRRSCSESEAIALPCQSRITTPKPALPKSRKIAPSKLIFRKPHGGEDHWNRGWLERSIG